MDLEETWFEDAVWINLTGCSEHDACGLMKRGECLHYLSDYQLLNKGSAA